jgi:hypothetical protein
MDLKNIPAKREPSKKEQILETLAVGMCFLLLFASFLKVMFF